MGTDYFALVSKSLSVQFFWPETGHSRTTARGRKVDTKVAISNMTTHWTTTAASACNIAWISIGDAIDLTFPPILVWFSRKFRRQKIAHTHQVVAGERQQRRKLDLASTPHLRSPQETGRVAIRARYRSPHESKWLVGLPADDQPDEQALRDCAQPRSSVL